MAQNIIFLDIDGVVHPLNEKHLPSLVNYDELINRCMTEDDMDDIEVLNGEFCDLQMAFLLEIINATSAKIVLSSTWRETEKGRRAVHQQLNKHGISSSIVIGYTPCLYQQYKCRRCHEIVQWLSQHTSLVANFVVLDDSDLLETDFAFEKKIESDDDTSIVDFIQPYFIRTKKEMALTKEDVAATIQLLNHGTTTTDETKHVVKQNWKEMEFQSAITSLRRAKEKRKQMEINSSESDNESDNDDNDDNDDNNDIKDKTETKETQEIPTATATATATATNTISTNTDLSSFVDINGNAICLKFHGYHNNFRKVPPGNCRWRQTCNLSHHPQLSVLTIQELQKQNKIFQLLQINIDKQETLLIQNRLSRPLPDWFEKECRSRLIFSTNTNKDTITTTDTTTTDTTTADNTTRKSAYDKLTESIATLLKLYWKVDATKDSKILSSRVLISAETDVKFSELHTNITLNENLVPVCPSLVHAYRLAGYALPKSWTRCYKQTKKMVKLMEKTTAYQIYLSNYRQFITDIIAPLFPSDKVKSIIYQFPPTLRIHPPGQAPTIQMHCDSEYSCHENGEVNFWIPLTKVFDSNTLWCETLPGHGDFAPFNLMPGEGIRFNGNQCRHFTKANATNCTRVSFDFRIIPTEVAVRPPNFHNRIGDYPTETMLIGDTTCK